MVTKQRRVKRRRRGRSCREFMPDMSTNEGKKKTGEEPEAVAPPPPAQGRKDLIICGENETTSSNFTFCLLCVGTTMHQEATPCDSNNVDPDLVTQDFESTENTNWKPLHHGGSTGR